MTSPASPPRFAEIEWLARTDDVNVRINTLEPRHGTPWHYHTVVDDHVFCMEGGLEVSLRDPPRAVRLAPGERVHVPPGQVHRVVNLTDRPLRYLLVQATGRYDFNVVEDQGP